VTVDLLRRGPTLLVTNIDYIAKAQGTYIAYANGARTNSEYDKFTICLTHLNTTRLADPDSTASLLFKNSTGVTNLVYTNDPTASITRIRRLYD
jgi:hypothetical protein